MIVEISWLGGDVVSCVQIKLVYVCVMMIICCICYSLFFIIVYSLFIYSRRTGFKEILQGIT